MKIDIYRVPIYGSDGKEPACNGGDMGSISGLGRSPGGGYGNPLHYSCLENPMDRGAWQATVHGVSESGMTEQRSTVALQGEFQAFILPPIVHPPTVHQPSMPPLSRTHSSSHLSIVSPSTLPPLILHPPLYLPSIHPQPPSVPLSGHHLCIPPSIYSSIHPSSTIHPLHPFTFVYSSTTTCPSLHPPSLYPRLHPPTLHPPIIPHQFLNVQGTARRPGCWSRK